MASKFREFSSTKKIGRVYTPEPVVALILDECGFSGKKILAKKVIDPACGDGQFLVEVVRRIIKVSPREQLRANLAMVHGWDLESEALAKCRERLNRLIEPFEFEMDWHLNQGDSAVTALELRDLDDNHKFDFVVGNPPYVRIQHLEKPTRELLTTSYSFCQRGSTDLYLAFLEMGLWISKLNGQVGFITPNSFLLTDAGAPAREIFGSGQNIQKLINFGAHQLFADASTYAAITIYGRRKSDEMVLEFRDSSLEKLRSSSVGYRDVVGRKVWNFEVEEELPGHLPLKAVCSIHVGIQTLADKVFIVPGSIKGKSKSVTITSKLGLGKFEVETKILKPAIKASKLKPDWDGKPNESIIWPYRRDSSGVMTIMSEEVIRSDFPGTYSYLLAHKDYLDLRDNGESNPVAWYAFGRSQHLSKVLGPKIIFPPMAEKPFFVKSSHKDLVVYSGYFIIYEGDLQSLESALNSDRMTKWVDSTGRDFRGSWKAISKKTIENFPVPDSLNSKSLNQLFN